jgi:hypothetical protein
VEVRRFEEWAVNFFSGFYLGWSLLPRLRTLIDGPSQEGAWGPFNHLTFKLVGASRAGQRRGEIAGT